MSGEKTEQPTAKKIRDARNKGQVAKSKEIVSTAIILILFAFLVSMSGFYLEHITNIIMLPAVYGYQSFDNALTDITDALITELLYLIIPIALLSACIAVVSHLIQFGLLFSAEPIKPELKKINPVEGAKRIFSIKSLVEFFKSILKVSLLTLIIWLVIQGNIQDILRIPLCGVSCIPLIVGTLLKQLILTAGVGLIIISIGDYAFERYQHTKQLKMTKDEVKREYKEMEGSPEIKSKRRQLHQEMQASNGRDNVKRSSVLVTNPTHIAIGIYYNKGETPLPVLTLKERGAQALDLIEYAKELGIPVIQKVPLARALHADAELNQYIPTELIQPVAEVLRWLQTLEQEQ
ncbi:EscU/YscU/HrcU family type III secretion system export apparatus switch protein [Shewanella psychropiezotolerans]|uniref:EscU/YscU/HrcU family type III secretion system export apparatus switch protein n=1 Tax=Shewanella psychropiezotolerans TaxID=2593655 RepID=A0ABX5X8W0_9GAMM|nr:type III secretion system export apparatus subunit SctU [Shewanella psychropiezotolerans]QDO86368.1 EscU/YscU/HrcU family type III secretion system export apparatus switch protein [Shewanella psychropiezotolerans]